MPEIEGVIAENRRATEHFLATVRHVPKFEHTFFGRVSIADYVRFGTLHTEHHERQLPA